MTRQMSEDEATAAVPQRRPHPLRPAPAGLAAAVGAALAIPALTIASGGALAATTAGPTPAPATSGPASAARAASRPALAWGRNDFGQLGNGTSTNASSPVSGRLPGGTTLRQARAGCNHTVALTARGQVLAWGLNSSGQLGNDSIASRPTPVRVRIPGGTKITAVRAGCDFSLALTSAGKVLAWGANSFGQLGNGTTADSHVPVLVQLPAATQVTAISAGSGFALARTAGGRVLAWGQNTNAELGNDSTTSSDVPLRVDLPVGLRVGIVSAGYDFALASVAGRPFAYYAWGANNLGQYGDGSTSGMAVPIGVIHRVRGPGHVHLTSLFAGCGHVLALFSDGAMLAWGANGEGQLGNGTTTTSYSPVAVRLGRATATAASASCADSYALTRDGHVLAWGYNGEGQLGHGGTADSDRPVRASLPSGWRAVAVGSGPLAGHLLAIRKA